MLKSHFITYLYQRRLKLHPRRRQHQLLSTGVMGMRSSSQGARLWYLPAYSPDLNPIEQAFSRIKHWMRMAQRRTLEDTWRHIGQLVQTIEPAECANYIANAGYRAT